MPRAVIAAHGELAAGLCSAVERVAGRGGAFVALSNTGLGPAEIEAQLRTALAEVGDLVVFTDLPAGSCTLAARRLQRELPGLTVVTGANLSMLLAYALSSASPAEAARVAVTKGTAAVAHHGGTDGG
ncbi:MAG: hypothetical protein K2X99_04505 [Gemmatimonadaceae bacterium]|nr:hypothetical protein [Gemmatimonadaceae bacterium]